ncbi:MAG: hypothetical protein WC229_00780 [Candidatus Paceibacterota bacterium]|jgi:hypothetical protein
MSKERSDILGYAGTVFELIKELTHAVLDAGGSDRDIRKILSDKKKAAQIAEILMTTNDCGMEWSKCFPRMSWYHAKEKAEDLNRHIRKDEKEWRLPTKAELLAIRGGMLNLVSFYWSSSHDSGDLIFTTNGCDGEGSEKFVSKHEKLPFFLVRPNE